MIFYDSPFYAISWFKNGGYHGYSKRTNPVMGMVNLEGLFKEGQFVNFDNQLSEDDNPEYYQQKALMYDHMNNFFLKT